MEVKLESCLSVQLESYCHLYLRHACQYVWQIHSIKWLHYYIACKSLTAMWQGRPMHKWTAGWMDRRQNRLVDEWIDLFLFLLPLRSLPQYNEGLEKARAYLNQVPRDQRLYIPSEGLNFRSKRLKNTPTHFWVELSRLLSDRIPVAIVVPEPGTSGSVVQHFNHLASNPMWWKE